MKLTTFTDYSLRVLIHLAADPSRRATIAEISAAFRVSENHMTKVVHFLGKQGWIETVRGKGGGIRLAKHPQAIVVGHVICGTEGAAMPAECFRIDEDNCAISSCCQLKGVLAEAVRAFYSVLDRHTLADITRNRQMLSNVLHFRHALPL
jgi:Rrf2 family transcriptional regulator, nitric oxide-sensitive transcriptional repressor